MGFIQNYFLPPVVALFYWLWSLTWRLRVIEHPEFRAALSNGPVSFAHWHTDNLVLVKLGRRYHVASMASTSRDGELITRVLKYFGFGIARGSSTRAGVRALVGMMTRIKEGYNPAIAVDGPKGPIFKVKPGIVYLAKHAEIPLIPTGVAKSSALVFNKAWDKTHFPWPFAKIIVSFGAPLYTERNPEDELMAKLETRLKEEKFAAEKALSSTEAL